MNTAISTNVSCYPKIIFIVPYRNRPQHKYFFLNYMTQTILKSKKEGLTNNDEKESNIEIYFSHQHDMRTFNRGAMKNIGFLAVKKKYPNDYQNMTFVFNDVDTIPFANIFNYNTIPGIVKHFYGFEYALGGIVAINGGDFEKVNGFPNYWGWGMEDKVLQTRCNNNSIQIDRSQFFPIGSPEILQLFDGVERLINPLDMLRSETDALTNAVSLNGVGSINLLSYKLTDGDSSFNNADNVYLIKNQNNKNQESAISIFFINATFFQTGINFEHEKKKMMHYDLRAGANQMTKNYTVAPEHLVTTPNTWKNIAAYPTTAQQQELIKKNGKKMAQEIIEHMYYKTNCREKPNLFKLTK